MPVDTFLLVGLGNPGRQYRDSRHNAGFMTLDRLAVRLAAQGMKLQSRAIVTSAVFEDHKVLLAKPQTFMNLSGQSVQGLMSFYKIPTSCLMVIADDLDLPLGTVRIRSSGGAGGQRGMGSIIEHLGTNEFPRLRIGIGRPPGRMDPADYVLQNFSREDLKLLPDILGHAEEAVLEFILRGLDTAMNKFNGSAVESR